MINRLDWKNKTKKRKEKKRQTSAEILLIKFKKNPLIY